MNKLTGKFSDIKSVSIVLSILIVVGIFIWQAIAFNGSPNFDSENLSNTSAILTCAVLVFREGLEAILVLAAITAALNRKQENNYERGVAAGAGLGIIATIGTWYIVVAILSNIKVDALDIQAATGLLAIIVLLVVMNWFFHRLYWTGWISHHTNRRKKLMESHDNSEFKMYKGFALLGFTAIYREGFEIVLFLQQLRLKDGSTIVLIGTALGLLLTSIIAVFTFKAHIHLPYRKMLILTGVMLGIVLLVMVGESVQEMQQANWIPATPVGISIPDWLGMWLAIFPNVQGLAAQGAAVMLVLGSYFSAQ